MQQETISAEIEQLNVLDFNQGELQVSWLTGVLIVRMQSKRKLVPPFEIKINGEAIPKSLSDIVLECGYDYVVSAMPLHDLCSGQTIELYDTNGYSLTTQLKDPCLLWLNGLLPWQLRKVHRGLIEKLPEVLTASRKLFVKALAIKNVDVVLLEDGRVYFHFVHSLFDCAYETATLEFQDAPGDSIALDLRFAQGHVYGLSHQALTAPLAGKVRIALLKAENLGVLALALKKPRRADSDKVLLKIFSPIILASKTRSAVIRMEGGTLRGYCFDEEKPYQALSVDAYLDGQYQTRLLADNPGIEFNSKPLNAGWAWDLDSAWLQGDDHEIDLVRADTQQRLAGCPYRLGADVFDTEFHLNDGQTLNGLIKARGLSLQQPIVEVHVDGEMLALAANSIQSQSVDLLSVWRVEIPLPSKLNDGCHHQILVQLTQDDRQLSQTKLSYQAQYVGALDRMDNELVSGWIYLKQSPYKAVNLDLLVNGRVIAQLLANHWPKASVKLTAEGSSLPCGFYFRLGPPTLYETCREISLRIAETDTDVLGPPVLFTPYDIVISTLMQAQAALHGAQEELALVNGIQVQSVATDWVRRQVLAPVIQALRTAKRIPKSLQLELSDSIRLPHQRTHDPVIDIILPVFQGLQETLICIRSVLDHTQQDYQLIVINDGSPDPALTKMLQGWAGAGAFTLLENPKNLGFVATVNHGMRQHPNRDVVLLNSDTIVTAGWLGRLQVAAMSASNIATATPLSNNATLLSFPIPCEENPMPNTQDLSQLAQQCAMINDGLVMDIPTAVGFCMYIKRDALDEIGDFDESSFGQGYAEENDFCLRASALGWRHVAACDVFVAHHGAKSFKDQKTALIARNLQTLNTIYPDYATTIERFIVQDSLRLARNGLIKSLLRAHTDGYILFVMHDLGGGVKTHVDDLAKRLQSTGVEVLALSADIHGTWKIAAYGLPYILSYQGDSAFENALADLKCLVIWHIHYHHILHFPHSVWTLPEHLSVEYDVTLHDYHAICPSINMIDETGQYCGDSQFDSANCNRCLRLNNMEDTNPGLGLSRQFETLNGNMTEWRDFYEKRLKNARRVFSPSQSTADIFLQHFGLANLLVQPHSENSVQITPSLQSSKAPYRIAIIGAIGLHKGYSLLVNCAKSALKNGLPLEFIIFGYTRDDLALNALENVSLTGAYTPEELPEKIAASGCQIAAFLSVWPETFAYTLSEAWRSGLYPVVFDLGALAERIRETGYGTLMPLTQDAKQINAALMDAAERLHRLEQTEFLLGRDYPDVLQDYYGFDVEATRLVQSIVSK